MTDVPWWLIAAVVVAAAGVALYAVFQRRGQPQPEDWYTRGLEQWLAGDLQEALRSFRLAIEQEPGAIDPYLQLGNLLRLTGEARRAAVIHRGLTVRGDVPRAKLLSVSLALADDLLALRRWQEAGQVLAELETPASRSPRFWHARFRQRLGENDESGAARALRNGADRTGEPDAGRFRLEYGFFQLDRALRAARDGNAGQARRLLKDVPDLPELAGRRHFVQALAAAQDGDGGRAIEMATAGLRDHPQEMALFLPTLREVLLQSGHYERTIPILENALEGDRAPAALRVSLALLYEKVGRRQDAVRLLEDSRADADLTPLAAAPLLRMIAAEEPHSDLARIWNALRLPPVATGWACSHCGARSPEVRWFCPSCQEFGTYEPARVEVEA